MTPARNGFGMTEAETLRLTPRPWIHWASLALYASLACIGLVFAARGSWAGLAGFLLALPFAVYCALATSPNGLYLELTSEGLAERTPLRQRAWRWEDFDGFYARQRGEEQIVAFRYYHGYEKLDKSGLFGRLDEWDGQLIRVGMTAAEQADVLNRWLARYVPDRKAKASLKTALPLEGKGVMAGLPRRAARSRTALFVCAIALVNLCLATYQVWGYVWARILFLSLIGLVGVAIVYLFLALRLEKRSPKELLVDEWT
jgi:hypothetical protein